MALEPKITGQRYRTCRIPPIYRFLFLVATLGLSLIFLDSVIGSRHSSLLNIAQPASGGKTAEEEAFSIEDFDHIPPPIDNDDYSTQWTTIPIDHNDLSVGMYRNRYWFNDRFYRPGGPVFVYDTGEGDAGGSVERFLLRNSSWVVALLEEFHGLGILWEHRYYEESNPVPVNSNSLADAFRFLTLEQALADVPYFAKHFKLPSFPHADLQPSSTPWIMMGCSYSGTRAALSRLRHPKTFYAAYSGSSPMLFTVRVPEYYEEVRLSLIDHGYGNCSRDLEEIARYVDTQLDDHHKASLIKQKFFGAGAELMSSNAFAWMLVAYFSYFKGWGVADGRPSLASLCTLLETDPVTGSVAGPDGLAPSTGAEALTERLASWNETIPLVNKFYKIQCGNESVPIHERCSTSVPTSMGNDTGSWLYQQCTEVGFFHTSRESHSLVSKYLSAKEHHEVCKARFPGSFNEEVSEFLERIDRTNDRYGGLAMRPSNVFWTTGQYDPWRSLSPLARSQVEPGPRPVTVLHDPAACNVSTGYEKIYGYILEDSGHCAVLVKNDTESRKAQRMFSDALHEWLPCFGKS